MHPSERIRGATSNRLQGRRIILGVTGSIAAVKAVELARELIRHGADVIPVMSREATRILHPNALEFATGHMPITEITGAVEHVRDLGRGPGKADLLLIAPCTGNTLAKIALGIDDSPVTTYASTGLATTPMVLAPAMHDTMYENPALTDRIAELRRRGVDIIEPWIDENKAKLPEPEVIVEHVLRALGSRVLAGKKILVINGSTIEPIDSMRVVTNRSTGRTGMALAREAFRMGAEVELWWGHGHSDAPPHIPTKRFVSVEDLVRLAPEARGFDAVLMPAAISDFGPVSRSGKAPSNTALHLELTPLPKVADAIRRHAEGVFVPFKAESGIEERQLIEKARESARKYRAAFVVANDLQGVHPDVTEVMLVDAHAVDHVKGAKEDVAEAILARLAREFGR
ncbi:MAG: bifunctional phosphopantothenoylcysteine decarboxylase/phosphopantothenate--cysteine ligase CoaBC [Thermoplasmatota archaeon]